MWGQWQLDCWKWIAWYCWGQFGDFGSHVKDWWWVGWAVGVPFPFWPIYLQGTGHKNLNRVRAWYCDLPGPIERVFVDFGFVHHADRLGTREGCLFRIWWNWLNIVVRRSRINSFSIRLSECGLGSVRFSGWGWVSRWRIARLGGEGTGKGTSESLRVCEQVFGGFGLQWGSFLLFSSLDIGEVIFEPCLIF